MLFDYICLSILVIGDYVTKHLFDIKLIFNTWRRKINEAHFN